MKLLVAKYTAPTINVERKLAQILKPYIDHNYTVENLKQSIEQIRNINTNSTLYSLDVVGLYPSTPVPDAIEIIGAKLTKAKKFNQIEVKEIIQLLHFINDNNYFQFNNIFKQNRGTPMGSPLSSILSEIMQQMESSITSTLLKPKLYIRYVDDILAEWTYSKQELVKFKELEKLYATIKFTIEKETPIPRYRNC